jgi:hypothetical protein
LADLPRGFVGHAPILGLPFGLRRSGSLVACLGRGTCSATLEGAGAGSSAWTSRRSAAGLRARPGSRDLALVNRPMTWPRRPSQTRRLANRGELPDPKNSEAEFNRRRSTHKSLSVRVNPLTSQLPFSTALLLDLASKSSTIRFHQEDDLGTGGDEGMLRVGWRAGGHGWPASMAAWCSRAIERSTAAMSASNWRNHSRVVCGSGAAWGLVRNETDPSVSGSLSAGCCGCDSARETLASWVMSAW